jgi:ceramide glucosyltransferase
MKAMKALVLALLASSGAVLCLFTAFTVAFRRGRKASGAGPGGYPFVSLLKPVKNIDDDMAANLESFYRLDYPAYEVLFAVDDFKDPCVAILRDLQARHPRIRTAIVATGHPPFENPKIHKLARLHSKSRAGLFWATDSNVRVAPDALRRLVDEYLAHDAKAVFSPIRGSSSRSFGSLIENSGLNFFTSGSIIASWFLGRQPIIVGKSILIEREALETFGGFRYFKDYLAEDFLLGEAFKKSGFRVSTNCTWVTNVSQTATLKGVFRRLSRWAKLRFRLRKPVYLCEVLLNPIVIALAGWAAFGRRGWTVLAVTAGLKIALEYVNFLFVNTEDRRRARNHLMFPAAVVAKDIVFFLVYLTPFFSRQVEWRGGRIAIGKKTLIHIPANVDNLVYEGA